jgi:iron complex outermembrane receptor protein
MTKSIKHTRLIPAAKRALLGGGVSLLALTVGLPQAAHAQQPANYDDSLQEVVVSGFRKSLAQALDAKNNNEDIVEAISAEDIGKLPEQSIADAIGRLPGLTVQRDTNGRDRFITIRGFGPDLQVATLNGREQVSTSNNRDVEFDQYPAELINQVLVYKTPDASLLGQGLAGSIDLETVRPLDYKGEILHVSAQGQYATNGKLQEGQNSTDMGERFSAIYIDRFAHDTLGVLVGYAHMSSPQQYYFQQNYPTYPSFMNNIPQGLQDFVFSDLLNRDAVTSTIQFRPDDKLNVTLDAFGSRYNEDTLRRGFEFQLGQQLAGSPASGACNGGVNSLPTCENPTLLSYNPSTGTSSWSNIDPQTVNDENQDKATLKSIGLNTKYNVTDSLKTSLDLSYSSAVRNLNDLQLWAGAGPGGQPYLENLTISGWQQGGLTSVSGWNQPNSFTLGTNKESWGGGGTENYIDTVDTIRAVAWDAEKDFDGPLAAIAGGVQYSARTKSYTQGQIGPLDQVNGGLSDSEAIPAAFYQGCANVSYFGEGCVPSVNPFALANSGYFSSSHTAWNYSGDNWRVSEDVWKGWLKANIDTQVAGHSLNGNIGVQFVHTDQSSYQLLEGIGGGTPYSDSYSYNEPLPSLNLQYHLDDKQQIRFGAAREMARPEMDFMAGSEVVKYNSSGSGNTSLATSPWSGSGGNIKLKPWIADAVDVSYENYLSKGTYFTAAVWYKNLESYLNEVGAIQDFSSYAAQYNIKSSFNQGVFTEYVNGNGGNMYGAELQGSIAGESIDPIFEGFGLLANGALTYGDLRDTSIIGTLASNASGAVGLTGKRIPGSSKWTADATLFYEKDGWSARIADRYRSTYVNEQLSYLFAVNPEMASPENIVDVQFGYSFTEGEAKGLDINFSASNITNQATSTYLNFDSKDRYYYYKYGSTLMFGMSYKL